MSKKILLIGGTGFIGKTVLDKLLHLTSYQIRILSRSKHKSTDSRIEYFQGDLLNLNDLIAAVKGVDIVIQSAQFKGHPVERPWLGAEYTYLGFDAKATQNTVKAIEYSQVTNNIKQYIYLSGAGSGDNLKNTSSKQYNWTKAKQIAESSIKDSGIPFTIFRPSWVYGKGDQSMSKFILFAKYLPVFPVIGDGKAPVNPVCVEDLAQMIINSLENQEVQNKIIEIGSLPEMNMKQVAQIVLKSVGASHKPIICHPKPLMKLAGIFAQFIPFSPISPNSVEFLTMDVHLQNLKEEILGVKIKSLESGLQESGLI
jgi:NADH dehydrogenase